MKKILSLLFFTAICVVSYAQNITEATCEVLKELYSFQTGSTLSNWEYYSGDDAQVQSISVCDCDDANDDIPDFADLDGIGVSSNNNGAWTGVFVDLNASSNKRIWSLDLRNRLTVANLSPAGSDLLLFKNTTALDALLHLKMGGTGSTKAPTFAANVLDNLTNLTWEYETKMDQLPNISAGLSSLVDIWYRDFDKLTASNSNVGQVNRANLEEMTLWDFEWVGSTPAFPDLFSNCAGSIEKIEIFSCFLNSAAGRWYPTSLAGEFCVGCSTTPPPVEAFPNLEIIYIKGNTFTSCDIDDDGEVFDDDMTALTTIVLDENGFTGDIPASLFEVLDDNMTFNSASISSNTGLNSTLVPANITTQIDEFICRGNTGLDNATYPLEDWDFSDLGSLSRLDLANCDLNCELADLDIASLTNLDRLYIGGNSLTGAVPAYYATAFTLEHFDCSDNLLTSMPVLTTTLLSYLRINYNFFDLDDVFNAINASRNELESTNNIRTDDVLLAPMYSRWGVTTINISSFSIEPDEAGIRSLTSREAGDFVANPNRYDRQWFETDNGSTPVITTLTGETGTTFDWNEERTDGTSGHTWYCETSLREVNLVGPQPATGQTTFYSEAVINAGRTKISYNAGDPCGYSGTPANAPFDDDEETDVQKDNTAQHDEFEFADSPIQNDKVSAVSVYPNPTNGTVTIKGSEDITFIELVDLNGKVMRTYPANGNQVDISTNGIEEGTYLVRVNQNGKVTTSKIVKAN